MIQFEYERGEMQSIRNLFDIQSNFLQYGFKGVLLFLVYNSRANRGCHLTLRKCSCRAATHMLFWTHDLDLHKRKLHDAHGYS